MRNGFKIFDADAHVIYPADLWSRYLDKRYVGRVGSRQPVPGFETYNPVTVDGRWTQHDTILYGQFQKYIDWTKDDMIAQYGEELVLDGFTGDRVANALARDGIDLSVIYGPEYDLWFDGIDPDLQAAMVRAYNRWGAEMRATSGGRVHTAGPVPLGDVTRAIAEIEHAYHHLGIRAFWARPDEFNHRTLGDRYYDPVWELIQDLDVPFSTHEFMGLRGNSFGSDRFRGYSEWHTVVHPFEAMGAMVSMICHGVYERFPRLRVAYLEAGCGWLPSWLHRIDEHLEAAGAREFPELTMSGPSALSTVWARVVVLYAVTVLASLPAVKAAAPTYRVLPSGDSVMAVAPGASRCVTVLPARSVTRTESVPELEVKNRWPWALCRRA